MDKLTKSPHVNAFFTHAHIYNCWIDFHQILHIHTLAGRSDIIFESPFKFVQGFWEDGNLASLIGFNVDL